MLSKAFKPIEIFLKFPLSILFLYRTQMTSYLLLILIVQIFISKITKYNANDFLFYYRHDFITTPWRHLCTIPYVSQIRKYQIGGFPYKFLSRVFFLTHYYSELFSGAAGSTLTQLLVSWLMCLAVRTIGKNYKNC